MDHTIALVASLVALGLTCVIYYCNVISRPGSRLRSETLAMILSSLLPGLLILALAASLVGLWKVVTGGLSLVAILAAGADIMAFGTILITVCVFWAIARAASRTQTGPSSVQPPANDPIGAPKTPSSRKAA